MWQRGDEKRALEAGGKNDGCRRQGKGGQAGGGEGERASEVGLGAKENERQRWGR